MKILPLILSKGDYNIMKITIKNYSLINNDLTISDVYQIDRLDRDRLMIFYWYSADRLDSMIVYNNQYEEIIIH